MGAAVAASGDNNALAGAIGAGGAEVAAPKISDWLYGTHDPEKMTAEQKETVSAITNLLGATTGAVLGNSATDAASGSLNAQSAVENNTFGISSPETAVRQEGIKASATGQWGEFLTRLEAVHGIESREALNIMRQMASKRGNHLVRELQRSGLGQGARSGQHGAAYSRASSILREEANKVTNPQLREVLKTEATRLLHRGRGINHK